MYRMIGADGREYGPFSADQLRQWAAENRANASTRVLPEGASEWVALGTLPDFAVLFGGAQQTPPSRTTTPPPEPPKAAPTPTPTPAPAPAPLRAPATFQQKNNPFAVAGMVMGILSLTLGICCYGLPFNVLGLVFSIIGMAQISNEPQKYRGHGMAIAGLVLSIASIFLAILFVAAFHGERWDAIRHHAHRL